MLEHDKHDKHDTNENYLIKKLLRRKLEGEEIGHESVSDERHPTNGQRDLNKYPSIKP